MTPATPGEQPGKRHGQEPLPSPTQDKPDDAGLDPFELYLEQRDQGEDGVLDLLEGAEGDPEMQERVHLLGALEQLSDLLVGAPEAELPDLERLGRFESLRIIGEGGLGRVFAGYDPRLEREVALKVLSPGGINVAGARDWMLSEGRSLAKLKHPCVVEVFDVDEADGFPYIAMERVDGPTLQEVLDHLRDGQGVGAGEVAARAADLQTMAQRLRLALDLAEAIAECHKQGVVHRDVKPGNVLLPASGRPKLIDFGLAHLEDAEGSLGLTQRLVGTPGYVAPEQVDEERTGSSPLSDQFSFAVILYELVTLKHPFRRGTKDETMRAVSRALPAPPRKIQPTTPVDIERIVLHALAREARYRYPSMIQLAADLRAFLEYRAISLRPPSPLRRARMWAHRNQRAVVGSALTVAVLGLLLTAAAALNTSRRVAAWEQRLASAEAAVTDLASPGDFLIALDNNNGLRTQAAALDNHLLRMLARPLEPRVTGLEAATTQGIRDRLIPEREPPYDSDAWLNRIHHQYSVDRKWLPVLSLERSFFEGTHPNDDLRDVGVVEMPEECTIFRYDPHSLGLTQLVPVERKARPQPGVYRLRIPRPNGGSGEVEFVVTGFEPRKKIELAPEVPSLLARMLPVEGRAIDPARISNGVHAYFVDDFFILPDAITWREYEQHMGPGVRNGFRSLARRGIVRAGDGALDDDHRAILTIEEAAAFAAAVGCRLATPIETALAIEKGVLELPATANVSSLHPAADSDPRYHDVSVGRLLKFLPSSEPWTSRAWLAADKPGDARSMANRFLLVLSGDLGR